MSDPKYKPMRVPPKQYPKKRGGFVVYGRDESRPYFLTPPVHVHTEREVEEWLAEYLCPHEPKRSSTGRLLSQVIEEEGLRWVILNFNPV